MPSIHIGEPFRIDAKPFVNRPFFLQEIKWAATDQLYKLLPTQFSKLPRDIIRSNQSLLEAVKIGSLYRSSAKLNISVAGTITHAGTLLVGVIPPTVDLPLTDAQPNLVNTILSGPHAFLHANEATSVLIDVPWYCNSDLDSLLFNENSLGNIGTLGINAPTGYLARLVCLVLSPLQPSNGSSDTLSVIVEAIFNNLDILVPCPRFIQYQPQSLINTGTKIVDSAAQFAKTVAGDAIDGLRGVIRKYTGLHNPNLAQLQTSVYSTTHNRGNNVDTAQFFEKLDPYAYSDRIVQEPIFHTQQDEMSIQNIISKRQYIGRFRVSSNDAVGTRVFNRPISPFQGGIVTAFSTGSPGILCNNIELLHKLSRGWKGSIKITIQSVMNNKQQVKLRLLQLYNPSANVYFNYPVYRSILQAPSHLLEFTGGGQEQSVTLPYLARNKITPCASDPITEALMSGVYYIYVAQPLANSDGSPLDIYFNVFMSLEPDFSFYGYSTEPLQASGPVNLIYTPQSINVMNAPQKQEVTQATFIPMEDTRLNPIMDIRPLIRRMYPVGSIRTGLETGETRINIHPLNKFMGESTDLSTTPLGTISKMYYGKSMGFKFRLRIQTDVGLSQAIGVKIAYVPPNYFASDRPIDPAYTNDVTLRSCVPDSNYIPFLPFEQLQAPFNYVTLPVSDSLTNVYEFIIPDSSFFKFVGGPTKMSQTKIPGVEFASEDAGHLVIVLTNDDLNPLHVDYYLEVGATDESRFGFHCIAPFVVFSNNGLTSNTSYNGTWYDLDEPPSVVYNQSDNRYLFYTRL